MSRATAGDGEPDAVGQIEEEIAVTRAQLEETVDELTAKLDVGAQARSLAARARNAALDEHDRPRSELIIGAIAALGVALLLVARRGRR